MSLHHEQNYGTILIRLHRYNKFTSYRYIKIHENESGAKKELNYQKIKYIRWEVFLI